MSAAQFAMVEELASLIKDNLSSKHIVLSIEETLIDFLQNDTSLDGILELEPMSPYHRMLLHRLADIYGFSHESVGEGDSRHLVLERCPESSIPSVLVSDVLWQYDQDESPITSHQFLRRNEVEELASLIKDNLSNKHVVLSVEETLIDLLQNDTSSDGILELEPMSPYHRMLLHRLADIYGFSHESVGEGDSRHLVLERCPESSIPSVLVSDVLCQCDQDESPITSHQLLRRKEVLPDFKMETTNFSPSTPFEEREAAYLAARERIFSLNDVETKETSAPKQRNNPVVARRMIAHALGRRICSTSRNLNPKPYEFENDTPGVTEVEKKVEKDVLDDSIVISREELSVRDNRVIRSPQSTDMDSSVVDVDKKTGNVVPGSGKVSQTGTNRKVGMNTENFEREHLGAAKRMFAHALGLPKEDNGLLLKHGEESRQVGLRS